MTTLNNSLVLITVKPCNFIKKEALAQVFFCEFCEISENTFFYRTFPVVASGLTEIKAKYETKAKYFLPQ